MPRHSKNIEFILPQCVQYIRHLKQLIAFLVVAYYSSNGYTQIKPYVTGEIGAAFWDYEFIDDDVGFALSGALGLDFKSTLGLELGYQNFGSMNYVAPETEGEVEVQSFSLAALLTLPVNSKFSLFFLGGGERVDIDEQSVNTPVFDSESRSEGFFGIGAHIPQDHRSSIKVMLSTHDGGDILKLSIGGKLQLIR